MTIEHTSTRYESERAFHDTLVESGEGRSADRFYAINASSWGCFRSKLLAEVAAFAEDRAPDILEYGSGAGAYASIALAEAGYASVGIDISEASVQAARARAERDFPEVDTRYEVMNAEQLDFDDDSFDIVCGNGVIHHLDLDRAYGEVARVLRPGGTALFAEPLGHNALINLYRRLTPEQRTDDEHPLRRPDVQLADAYFGRVEAWYFHLFVLLAVPLARSPLFDPARRALDRIDSELFRLLPPARRQAWQVVLRLTLPR